MGLRGRNRNKGEVKPPARRGKHARGGSPSPRRAPRRRPQRGAPREAAAEGIDGDRVRLQKALAEAGLGSRRACEALIAEGRVEVDRQSVTELGTRVDPWKQEIRVDGVPLPRPKRVYYAVNKPPGVLCTNRDQSGRPRVIDLLPKGHTRVYTVGRLDATSEGLVLLTNDGDLAHRLMHPKFEVSKSYLVLVAGVPTPESLAQLTRGVHLAEGLARVDRLRILRGHKKSTWLEMVLHEGKNRELRRVLARVGHKVLRLRRVAMGGVRLGPLEPGQYRKLEPAEIDALRHRPQTVAGAATGSANPLLAPLADETAQGEAALSEQSQALEEENASAYAKKPGHASGSPHKGRGAARRRAARGLIIEGGRAQGAFARRPKRKASQQAASETVPNRAENKKPPGAPGREKPPRAKPKSKFGTVIGGSEPDRRQRRKGKPIKGKPPLGKFRRGKPPHGKRSSGDGMADSRRPNT